MQRIEKKSFKMKRLSTVLIVIVVLTAIIDFISTSFNTFSMRVAPTEKSCAYIVKSDLDSQGGDCLHYYVYQIDSKPYTGSFRVGSKDCEYKHKLKEKIFIKYLLHRPWISRYFSKDYDNEETQIPLYVKKYLQ